MSRDSFFLNDTEFISFTLILVCIVSDKNAFAVLTTPQAFLLASRDVGNLNKNNGFLPSDVRFRAS